MNLSHRFPLLFALTFLIFTSIIPFASAQNDYQNTNLPIDKRVSDLISKMTLAEKISQLGNQATAITRLGIPAYDYWSEALHGVARSGLATSFPQAIALSSTWDPDLIFNVASAISDEARVKNNTDGKGLTYWCPTINMARDPRWGRSEENYGEDTYLTSQIAVNFIKGMQGNDPKYLKTVATAKHFAANNIEVNRYGISSEVDERSLREYFLPSFKACVTKGKVFSIMSAYNALNGVPCPANSTLLTHILREEWGFGGYVVSDCDAVSNVWDAHHYVATASDATAISLKNGTDLNCGTTFPANANTAISNGILSEEVINISLKRVFKARFLLGEFDPPSMVPYKSIPASKLDCQANRDLALKAAHEAIVLLKNINSLLPLNKDSVKSIALIGPNASVVQLGGYSGSPSVSISPLMGISAKLGVDVSNGTIEAENFSKQQGIQSETSSEGGSNIGYIENGDYTEYDSIRFDPGKDRLDVRVASNTSGGNIEIRLDNLTATPLATISVKGTSGWQNWVTLTSVIPKATGIHNVFLKYTGGAGYLFNVNWFRFYDSSNPNPPASDKLNYVMGCTIKGAADPVAIAQAVSLAKKSEIAIVFCGTDLTVADEGADRTSLNLPGAQEQLLKAVFRANPKTILVLVNGYSLAINWAQDSIPAIVSAWYGGQAQGTAISDVLFGSFNPRGKLSTTWYKSTADLPPMNDYNIKHNRTYQYFKGKPLYPFGHGLSYTTFEYSNLKISSQDLNLGDSIQISTEIKNSGKVAGDEVAQLYVHTNSAQDIRPIRELKGFQSVHLLPGESRTVNFVLKNSDLLHYDVESRTFIVDGGKADIEVGSSSQDIRLNSQINLQAGTVGTTYRQDPFAKTEAENFENKSSTGAIISSCAAGGQCLSSLVNLSYVGYKNFDFSTEALQFDASLSSLSDIQSSIEVVLDSINGSPAGTLKIAKTGITDNYLVQSCTLTGVKGVRDVYLVFKTRGVTACKLNWVQFQKTIGTGSNEIKKEDDYQLKIYPNPSPSELTVNYRLPSASDVKIEIFSSAGTLIRTENKKMLGAGDYQTKIDRNKLGLKAGSYLMKFATGKFSQTLVFELTE